MPIRKITDDEAQQMPLFLQPLAYKNYLAPGANGGNGGSGVIAHVTPFNSKQDTNTVFVDDTNKFTPGVLAHELTHQAQRQAGGIVAQPKFHGALSNQEYGSNFEYGGLEGLKALPSISKLNAEQQANIPQDYMAEMQDWTTRQVTPAMLRGADALNDAYARPMRQLANMANPSTTSIDTTPAAPGPPPAALTGMIKPLPEIGGKTLYRSQ